MTLSPLTRRRWANFGAHRRGYLSLKVFAALLIVSFLAEFVANDKPLVLVYDGEVYWPVLVRYGRRLSVARWTPRRLPRPRRAGPDRLGVTPGGDPTNRRARWHPRVRPALYSPVSGLFGSVSPSVSRHVA